MSTSLVRRLVRGCPYWALRVTGGIERARSRRLGGMAHLAARVGRPQYSAAAEGRSGMNIFDRNSKRLQKNRAAASPDAATYDYLKDEVAAQMVERVCDVARHFPLALDVGCGRGHIAKVVSADLLDSLYQCDTAEQALVSRMAR